MTCKEVNPELTSPQISEVVTMKKYYETLKTYIEQHPVNSEEKEPGLLPAHIISSTY